MIEAIVDRDERWEESLVGREQYIDRPIQPPGLLGSGKLTLTSGFALGPSLILAL